MATGYSNKEYGPHKYDKHGTSNCAHGCKCWAGPSRSGGPLGLDPFGSCPNNPVDGKLLGGQEDYEEVVLQRIIRAEKRAYETETKLKSVEPGALQLAATLGSTIAELERSNRTLAEIQRQLDAFFKK